MGERGGERVCVSVGVRVGGRVRMCQTQRNMMDIKGKVVNRVCKLCSYLSSPSTLTLRWIQGWRASSTPSQSWLPSYCHLQGHCNCCSCYCW